MNKTIYFFLSIFFFSVIFTSCGGADDEKFLSEGIIQFDAKVVDNSNPMASMAPSKMTLKFKDNKSIVEMSAGMGLFSTAFISNPDEKSLTQMMKLLNKKFALVQNMKEILDENENYPLELIPTKETKIIAGYNCVKVHVKVKNENNDEFDIFYTNELDIQNSNFANPYTKIDGVLMEYQMKKFGLEMKFTAKSVSKADIDDEVFKLNKEYKIISKEEMDGIFEGMM